MGGGGRSNWKPDKGKKIADPAVEQLGNSVANVGLHPHDDNGWEVYGKKSKNKAVNAGKPSPLNAGPKAWGVPDVVGKLGMRTTNASKPPASSCPSWGPAEYPVDNGGDDDVDDGSDFDDFEDDVMSDEYDSDSSSKSHDTRKKNNWFKELFEKLDSLTLEEISDPEKKWHCPACKGGPGAIDWYHGMQPLVNHAKTKGTVRVKLHRELAKLLEEELRRRGTSAVPAGERFGKWIGLENAAEKEILWPPMVIIMNSRLERDMNDKWIGMGNQELVDIFGEFAPSKAQHSYGPQGHRGMSLLIYDASAVGYLEAQRLCNHFVDSGRGREAWERNSRHGVSFYPGGNRPLYGYMAEKRDMEDFNQHYQDKQRLKYEMQSYHEKVVKEWRKMSEDNQQLDWLKKKVASEQRMNKALEESNKLLTQKLKKTEEENRIVRLRTKELHEQSIEELNYQEEYFKERIQALHEARVAKEEDFEKNQQEKRD